MTDWQRVEQLIGSHNLEQLAQKRVGVIGLGSGGSFVATSLAMSGVGHFMLADPDVMEAGNVVRHVADRRYVGQNKATAVADLILHRNPNAKIDVIEDRIENHESALDNLDMLVVAVDGENAKFIINELALKRHLTAVYAGVYERGEGGDIVIIRPYDGPCYACWSQSLRDGAPTTSRTPEGELDYGMIGEAGTLEAEPGLWVHVTKVGSIQTDIILNELLRGSDVHEDMPGNTVIVANSAIEILDGVVSDPHTGLWVNIPRDPECLVCGDKIQLAQDEASMSLEDLMGSDGMGSMIEMQDEPEQQTQRGEDG
jgi:molybdopterin/thiamine biosynthesis adenylyltransferase